MHQPPSTAPQPKRNRPKALPVFLAAFVAGAAAAVGVNQALDVHLSQKKPQVESEPIFVAMRSLPQGSPVTIWDVALRDWPKAMLPTTALRADDSFEGCVLRHPLREGQPLLSVQLMRAGQTAQADQVPTETTFAPPTPAAPVARAVEADLWTPSPATPQPATKPAVPTPVAATQPVGPLQQAAVVPQVVAAPPQPTSTDVAPPAAIADVPAADATAESVAEPVPIAIEAVAPSTPVAVDENSVPVVVSGEPTLADPVPGEPTPADTPPPAEVGVESVVAARSVTAPADAARQPADEPTPADVVGEDAVATATPTAPRKPRDGITRYLVVPERIALQADAGFAEPPPAAQQPPAVKEPAVESLPPVRPDAPSQARSKPSAPQRSAQQVAPTSRPQPSPRSRPQPTGQPTRRQPTPQGSRQATTAKPRGLGAMFPNLAAGIEAMTGSARKSGEAAEGYDQAVATDDPSYRE
jgi:homeobox protein ESX1